MTLTINAEPDEDNNYYFDGWKENDAVVSAEPVYTFPVTADRALIAAFLQSQYTPGVDWWESTLPSSANWRSVTYGAGKFVAVATSNTNKAAYSTDGITWAAATLPKSESWSNVVFGNGKFVAVASSSSNAAAYSTDGINWTAAILPSTQYWNGLTFGDGKFVAVANGAQGAYSTDGIRAVL